MRHPGVTALAADKSGVKPIPAKRDHAIRRGQALLGAGLLVVAIGTAVVGWVVHENAVRLQRDQERVEHTYEVLSAIDHTFLALQGAETAYRGYVITGQEEFLVSYEEGVVAAEQHMVRLKTLATHPSVAEDLTSLEELVAARTANLREGMGLYETAGFAGAQAFVAAGTGKRVMDSIRTTITRIEQAETELLKTRRADSARSTDVAYLTMGGLAALCFVLVLAMLLTLRRSLRNASRAQASDARLSAMVASSPDAIVSFNRERVISSWNPGAERVFGYGADAVVGQPFTFLLPEAERDSVEAGLDYLASRPSVLEAQAVRLHRDGREIPVSVSRFRISRDGDEQEFGVIMRDMSERVRSQRALTAAMDEAERANHAKSEFLSRMSHELRTPLNVILGFGQILQLDPLDPDQEDSVSHILKAGRHLLALIDEVLDISRIEAGELGLSMEPVRVDDVTMEVVELVRPLARQRGITIQADTVHCRGFVLADRQRLKQVLLNLLSNGVKYNSENGTLRVACAEEGENVRLLVSDTGAGITDEGLNRLFKPFDRLGAEMSEVEGTGLGLSLSKRLAEAMGGSIGVESRLGEGTTFWVELARTEINTTSEPEPPVLIPVPSASAAKRKVLYIEDNLTNFSVVERVLARRPQIELIPALQGRVGIDLAREHQPALILLDLHLPDMPGADVLRALKQHPATAGIRVVIASADATPGQVSRLLGAGAAAYLTKPLDIRELLDLVDQLDSLEEAS